MPTGHPDKSDNNQVFDLKPLTSNYRLNPVSETYSFFFQDEEKWEEAKQVLIQLGYTEAED